MIAVDLDGTLLNSKSSISQENASALREAVNRGVEIVPVTGRNFTFALPALAQLPFEGTLISSNGAVIRSTTGETYHRTLLPAETAGLILQATRDYRAFAVVMYDQPGAGQLRIQRRSSPGPHSPAGDPWDGSGWLDKNRSRVQLFDALEDALDDSPLEILFRGPAAAIRELEAQMRSTLSELDCANGAHVDPTRGFRMLLTEYPERDFGMLDVIRGDCSKGRALELWSRSRGIRPAEIMALGDNYNDLEMLRFAGLAVVMGNAALSMRQSGWPVTLDCDSNGVAHAIRQYIL